MSIEVLGAGGGVKSVQAGSWQETVSGEAVTIAEVDPEKTSVLSGGARRAVTSSNGIPAIYLENATTIRNYNPDSNGVYIRYQAVEYKNAKVQRGLVNMTSMAEIINIAEVDPAKTVVNVTYGLDSNDIGMEDFLHFYLNGPTRLDLRRFDSTDDMFVSWEVIEFA